MHPRATIDRYVADGLAAAGERTLRQHLKACARCRAYYDEQRVIFRALAGDANRPTRHELAVHGSLAARAVFPEDKASPGTRQATLADLVDRLLWLPARTWALGAGAVTAAVVVFLIVLGPSGAGAGSMPLAAIVTRTKAASVAGVALAEAAELRALDVIEVPKGGFLELALVRGGTLRVFPASRLALAARGEAVTLDHGKLWCLPETGRGSFEVTTATATVRVLGTSFIVDADEEKTDVRVISGSVEVSDSDERGRVRLQNEESTRVERGQRPRPPRRASTSADRNEWQHFLDELLKSISRGVKALQHELHKGGRR